jgi:hypothetical protein
MNSLVRLLCLILVGFASVASAQMEERTLPAGCGWSASERTIVLINTLMFTKLGGDEWESVLTNIWIAEESKPLRFKVRKVRWTGPEPGTFTFLDAATQGDRQVWLNDLQAAKPKLADQSAAVKRSNDHYFNAANGVNQQYTVMAGSDGTAKLSGTVSLGHGSYITHHPYDVAIPVQGGSLGIDEDNLVPAVSTVTVGSGMQLAYTQPCRSCLAGTPPQSTDLGLQTFSASNDTLRVMADGSLLANIFTPVDNAALAWARTSAGAYRHSLAQRFASGRFETAGQLLASADPLEGPERLLFIGWGVTLGGSYTKENPGTLSYRNGNAAYPGLNFECDSGGPFFASSRLTDADYGPYELASDSKYLVRWSGVTGRHNGAPLEPGNRALLIYGFNTELSSFGLTFLSNDSDHQASFPTSRVAGLFSIPPPADLTVPFNRLDFDCSGQITEIEPGSGFANPVLGYWKMPFTPVTLRFPAQEACADPRRVPLGIMSVIQLTQVDEPLFGEIGLWPDGELVTQWDAVTPHPAVNKRVTGGITSRFPLPTQFKITGPGSERYTLVSSVFGYLNTHEVAAMNASNGPVSGFFNVAGFLNVPFFEDMPVHLHLSARTPPEGSLTFMHLMGGWPSHGWEENGSHFFNSQEFDSRNAGHPSMHSITSYRQGIDNTDQYCPRARQSWMGFAAFDHPLRWNSQRRVLEGRGSAEQNLFVFKAESDIPVITPKRTEIHFGASYPGLGRISLANFAYNAIDDATGTANAWALAGVDDVRQSMEQGLDAVAGLLADDVEKVIGPALDSVLADAALAWPPANLNLDLQAELDTKFDRGEIGATELLGLFIPASPDGAVAVLSELDGALALMQQFYQDFGGDGGLLDNAGAAPQLISALLHSVLGAPQIGTQEIQNLWQKAQPTLTNLKHGCTEMSAQIAAARAKLAVGQMIRQELAARMAPLEAQINDAIENARVAVSAELSLTLTQGHGYNDRTAAEWRALLRRELIKALNEVTAMKRVVQQLARNHLSATESKARELVDAYFQALNQTLREAVAASLPQVDQRLNSYLGDRIGAGQFDGYAHINGDSLRELRVNAALEFRVPDPMRLNGYLLIKDMQADGPKGCYGGANSAYLVELGAEDVALRYKQFDLRADLAAKFAFIDGQPRGFGGRFETKGRMDFETFQINALIATTMVTASDGDNYVSGFADIKVQDAGMAGGVFLGRACSVEPIEMWDPFAADFLGGGRIFTGVYAYGEGRMPIVNYGCAFKIAAGVGLGAFFFKEGPEIGGRAHLEVKGEALCTVSVKGDVDLIGSVSGDRGLRMSGRGRIRGKVGWCPCCVKFRKTVSISYSNGSYSADY